MRQSTIDSIRRLAERPGTEHEGIVAREMLKKLEGKTKRGLIPSLVDLLHKYDIPTTIRCKCGQERESTSGPCDNVLGHLIIQEEIREAFKRGDRVYYNYWAYKENCPGTVAAHVKARQANNDYPWGWISVKFDHLKSARQIPILDNEGKWCLTKEPKL